jgi:hypothetical protein
VAPKAALPVAPTGVSASPGDERATVTWHAPNDDGGSSITGYDVQYSANGGSSWTSAANAFHTSTATSQTVMGLINGTSYLFRVAAINTSGTGAYSTPSAAVTPASDQSSLSSGTAGSIKFGESITLTTTLTAGNDGEPVSDQSLYLLGRTGTSDVWTRVRTATTNGAGGASATVAPQANTEYEWAFAGDTDHTSATSQPEWVIVSQVVAAHLAKSHRKTGKTVDVVGAIAPNSEGRTVVLQRLAKGHWTSTSHTAVVMNQQMPNGRKALGFQITFIARHHGHYTYRILRAATTTNARGLSAPLHLTVA